MNQQPYPTDGNPQRDWQSGGNTHQTNGAGGPGPSSFHTAQGSGMPTDVAPRTAEERSVSIVAHLSAIAAAVLSAGSLSLVGPLAVWFAYRDRSAAVRHAAAGAFNFNLSMWIVYWAGWLAFITFIGIPLAIVLWIFAGCAMLFCHIRAAMASNRGESYEYPFQLRILK